MELTEEIIAERIAALPPLTEAQRRLNIKRLVKRHVPKGDDTRWMLGKTKDTAPRCGGILVSGVIPDTAVFPQTNEDRMWTVVRDTMCDGCPVRARCKAFGISNEYPGLWGGELISQRGIERRRKERRREAREARETEVDVIAQAS